MSREIKIRAWDDALKFMVDASKYHITLDGYAFFNNDGELYDQTDKLEILQYTGLYDNNQAMVCEGDVVSDHVGKGVVEYSDKYAGFRVNYRNGRCKWFYDYNLRGERESIEVIGNIYENPDLISSIGEDDEQIPG